MSKPHLSLVLFCLSVAVCSAGVLPRTSNDLQNDVLNLEASEKDVSKLGSNSDMLEDGIGEKKNIEPKSTNSSLDVAESEITKIEEVRNVTNAFPHLDDAGQDIKDITLEDASQLSPIKISNDLGSQARELKDIEDSDFNTANSEFVINSTSAKISNETEELLLPNEHLNETTENTQESKTQHNSSEFLITEEMDIGKEDNKSLISGKLSASFSLLPNDTIQIDDLNYTENSSSLKELEIFLNETEVLDAVNLNGTGIIEEIGLSINVTLDSEEMLSNLSAVITPDNSTHFMNETDAFRKANFSGDFVRNEEHNESSVMFANETVGADLSNEWSSEEQNSSFTVFSNDTKSLTNISFENITDIDVGNVTSFDSLNDTDVLDHVEVNNSNSEDLELDSFTLNETEVSSVNTETMVDSENLSAKFDIENTPIEGSSTLSNEKESEGLFSNFGFDFLKNSQIAKNAAKAMEIFNLSDSITDHIIEEHEFHSFLDAAPVSAESVDVLVPVKLPQEKIDPSIFNVNGSPEGLKTLGDTIVNASETSLVKEIPDIEGVTLLNDTMLSDIAESSSNMSDTGVVNIDEANLPSNSSEITTGFNETTADITNSSISDVKVNATAASPKCPPPGVCIFWFLAQDTCALNSHCLGSRICCRIRCSKTCIEV